MVLLEPLSLGQKGSRGMIYERDRHPMIDYFLSGREHAASHSGRLSGLPHTFAEKIAQLL